MGSRHFQWLGDEHEQHVHAGLLKRNEALLERVTVLERALEWIAEHETDEETIAERTVCDHEFHTTRPPRSNASVSSMLLSMVGNRWKLAKCGG